nr:MAG: Rpn family recombination-promoting nuclease/putative transposase [Leptolyngbya sp. IPPAS B-1204]
MYDNICKYLIEHYTTDFATWLLGEAVTLTELSPSELSLQPIRADALVLLQSDQVVLHVEFQTQPKPDVPFRMADYRLRVYRRFPNKAMRQAVVYLYPTTSPLAYQSAFEIPGTRHEYEVVRLWEQPTELFFQSPGLLPFAVLSQTSQPEQTLQRVATAIEDFPERVAQSDIAASTAILAGLILEQQVIRRVLRRDIMQESVIYQDILTEGLEKGRAEGLEEGRKEASLNLVLRQLNRQLQNALSEPLQVQITRLSLAQLEQLSEALLDFKTIADLEAWLAAQQEQQQADG